MGHPCPARLIRLVLLVVVSSSTLEVEGRQHSEEPHCVRRHPGMNVKNAQFAQNLIRCGM
jgi:hypothetical protein